MSGNTRFSVAIHVLAVLGSLEKVGVKLVASGQIAQSVSTNPVVIRNLLRALKRAGLIESKEGKLGGARLARKPSRISLQEIHAAVDAESVFAACKKPPFKPCPVSRGMKAAFAVVAREADDAVAAVLRGKTLQDVMDRL